MIGEKRVNWQNILGWILVIIGILLFISTFYGCVGTENDFQCVLVSLLLSASNIYIGFLFLIGGVIILAIKKERKNKGILIVGIILFVSLILFLVYPEISYNKQRISCPSADKVETVMTEGFEIIANFNNDILNITAGPCYERTYTWDGKSCTILQHAREKRWYGNLGIYSPSSADWKRNCKGLVHSIVEEGQQHFESIDEATDWIIKRHSREFPPVYTNEGLFISWIRDYDDILSVYVWQIYINGTKPTKLDGAQDDKIKIRLN